MKISDLKQPYRRMAEYLDYNKDENCTDLTNTLYWLKVINNEYPPINKEIKKHFPPDFDFSEEENQIKCTFKEMLENQKKLITKKLKKDFNFAELQDTCEFSEPMELEVWNNDDCKVIRLISGKFLGLYLVKNPNERQVYSYLFAQLPTPKIDFSQFKIGDVVEIKTKSHGTYYGIISEIIKNFIKLSPDDKFMTNTDIQKEKINLITKLK